LDGYGNQNGSQHPFFCFEDNNTAGEAVASEEIGFMLYLSLASLH
jgi:hypothetical protein